MTQQKRSPWSRSGVVGLLAAGSLLATSCGGGDAGEDDGADAADRNAAAMEDFAVGDSFVATEPLELSVLYRNNPDHGLDQDWMFFDHLEENHNVSLSIVDAPLSDFEQRRSLVIGAGDMPDFVPVTYPGQEVPYISGGALLPVSDYLEHMPHFTEKLDAWDLREDYEALYQEDGKAYILPGLLEDPFQHFSLVVRGDIWDEMGFEEPETWEEFADQLREVKEEYPDAVPYSDRWELQSTLNFASANFNTVAGWGYGDGIYFDHEAEEFIYAGASEEYRELLEFFAGLLDEGLMDSETLTQDDRTAEQKFSAGSSLATAGNDESTQIYTRGFEELGTEGAEARLIPIPGGEDGDFVHSGARFDSGLAISSSVAEDDDFLAKLQFIDWLYYSDEGLEFATWGVEGETYTVGENGERELDPNIDLNSLNPEAEEHLVRDYGFSNQPFLHAVGSTTDLVHSTFRPHVVEWQEKMHDKEELPVTPPYPFTDLELEQAGLLQTTLTDHVQTASAQFILGQRSFDDWDAYVAELENLNMQQLVDLANDAYERAQ
ncbi:extracellular solute-binding protein [Nesterenkonia sandarakina]|uniref:Putative aldouronate transport system substrate-binding protein n=1 Tax=Nesterenkonia sandarakina TaxID=272918 RepID=A0A7Z0EAJ5_9MICC|nr:extracellular solute-binding protein [Nesterenkonia sandarakina]NYJ17983.1 putative aldouronate transport system substrate-binding protein [Nesterenkonia sandarakina]